MLFINNTQRSARYAPTHGSTMRSSSMWATASRPLSTTLSPSCTQMWSQQCASSLTATISSPPPGTVGFLCCTWAPTSTTECGSTTITTMSPSPSRPHWPPSGRTWSHPNCILTNRRIPVFCLFVCFWQWANCSQRVPILSDGHKEWKGSSISGSPQDHYKKKKNH